MKLTNLQLSIGLTIVLFLLQIRLSAPFKYRDEAVAKHILNTTEKNLNFSGYLSNEQLMQFIDDFNEKYPELTRTYEIGRSAQNRSLKVLAISKSINTERPLLKPSVKLIANQVGFLAPFNG